jgi:hypothetical protein
MEGDMQQTWNWRVACQTYNRLTAPMWFAGWTIPLVVSFALISVSFWQRVAADTALAISEQIDYEDGALCAKFGFVAFTDKFVSCKLDLLDLRRRDEEMLVKISIP